MAVKKCCIDNCKSCSTRKEDKGVTYHKFPKDITLRDTWMSVAHHKHSATDLPKYVCSRHFCKTDFQIYKDSKYVLKSDAVPSIFPWNVADNDINMESESSTQDSVLTSNNESIMAKDSEESVDAIKQFIEAQEKEIQIVKGATSTSENSSDKAMDGKLNQCETMSMANCVMDMIINESDLETAKKSDNSMNGKFMGTAEKGNGSMALSIGSKVEAKDFGDEWYVAEIVEVDYDEMEVLVHYHTDTKKHDEWISVSSPRLRPSGSATILPGPSSAESWSSDATASALSNVRDEGKDQKVEEKKVHPTYVVGERCLCRWRDNRRFVATIRNILANGSYEVIFDDGCQWTCKVTRLYKLRPGKDRPVAGPTLPNTPLQYGPGPSNTAPQTNPYPIYQTHLFDPTRDYLGSKSERREMKRKLNIKEIFNIGQKRPKTQRNKDKGERTPVERKPRIIRRKGLKLKRKNREMAEVKTDNIPAADAVASIIGTVKQEMPPEVKVEESTASESESQDKSEPMEVDLKDNPPPEVDEDTQHTNATIPILGTIEEESDKIELEDLKPYLDPEVLEEEVTLEQFEKPDEGTHEEVIDRIKEAINKLEDGINRAENSNSPKPELKIPTSIGVVHEEPTAEETTSAPAEIETTLPEDTPKEKGTKKSKVKKGKKLRIIRQKVVKKQVEKVKTELAQMKMQMSEMRHRIKPNEGEMPEALLLPTEWCCKWVNGQPVGTVSEIECEVKPDATGKAPLPRRSVQVVDKRLPEGWTKHMVRRSFGHSAGKWDVVLVSPDNRRFHTKNEMRVYLENNPDKELQAYEYALTDFGVHLKLARRMGWITHTPDGIADGPDNQLPAGTLSSTSPLVKRKKLGLKKKGSKVKNKVPKLTIKLKIPDEPPPEEAVDPTKYLTSMEDPMCGGEPSFGPLNTPALEDGYVFVGSLKVQIIDNLLRCPADDCFKNFRNNTLLQMHIKHYHRELRKMMGATPKVLDLAYARTAPVETEMPRAKEDSKIIKVKIPRPPKPKPEKVEKEEPKIDIVVEKLEVELENALTSIKENEVVIPRSQDSPKLRQALINKPVKRPKVLLPVRRVEPEQVISEAVSEESEIEMKEPNEPLVEIPPIETLDFEAAISTHTVTKSTVEKKRKGEKKKKSFVLPPKGPMSEEEDWFAANSDVETRSSFPRSGTPDSKVEGKAAFASSESNEENKDSHLYTYNEFGERVKIVHMKREEIINCHCGFREEDGLMVQCELCLCWQHALCHNILREADVPDKYTCSICVNPWRGRRSQRFLHEQERLYGGLLPGAAAPREALRRSHELAGNLLRVHDALYSLRLKYYVATKKDHPKLYLWAQDWDQAEIQYNQDKLNSDYSDLNIMINNIGKENMPVKPEEVKEIPLEVRTSPSEDNDPERFSQRDAPLGSQSLLSGLLSSPGGASLDLPISASELERLAKSVEEPLEEQEVAAPPITVPQPEAAIENSACRARLLQHLQRCQVLIDARLDSIEAQVAELESQDPSFEDDETADYFPRTKQTIQMLMRDLDTMEELGIIT